VATLNNREEDVQCVLRRSVPSSKEIHGIGFATADQIAESVGIPKDSQNKARLGSTMCSSGQPRKVIALCRWRS
jgi:ATP-dependent exoDNAse (exonuclease V) alpha subunit